MNWVIDSTVKYRMDEWMGGKARAQGMMYTWQEQEQELEQEQEQGQEHA